MNARRLCILVTAVGIGGVATRGAVADVDLVWSPPAQAVLAGTVIEIDLYAVSNNNEGETIAAIDVVLTWDPQRLLLLGVVDNGPYQWLESGFRPFGQVDFDGLSASLIDGDAKYTALSAAPGEPAVATPEGLLVTTFQFFALSEVDASEIVIEERLSDTAVTRVFGGDAPNNPVTGALNNASVTIVRRPKTLRSASQPATARVDDLLGASSHVVFRVDRTGREESGRVVSAPSRSRLGKGSKPNTQNAVLTED